MYALVWPLTFAVNVLNDNSVLGENSTYNPANQHWRDVTSSLLPRLFKISAQLDF